MAVRRARGRPAGAAQLRPHARPTPWRSPPTTTCPTARRSAVGLVYAAELARELGRIDDDRGRRAPRRRRRRRTASTTTLPAGLDADELVALMGRDKKALDGLTFVLDGPAGVEVVSGVDPTVVRATLATPDPAAERDPRIDAPIRIAHPLRSSGAMSVRRAWTSTADRAAAARAQPRTCSASASRRSTAPPRSPTTSPRRGRPPTRTASPSRTCQSNHEGELVDAIHARPRPLRGDRHQPRRLHPLRLGHPRRARRVRRPDRRAAPVQPQRPRAVAPHERGRPGRHRHDRRLRRPRLRAGRRGAVARPSLGGPGMRPPTPAADRRTPRRRRHASRGPARRAPTVARWSSPTCRTSAG